MVRDFTFLDGGRSLQLELRHVDDGQLLDIGLVRGEDGSLRLADDPSQLALPPKPRWGAFGKLKNSYRRLLHGIVKPA